MRSRLASGVCRCCEERQSARDQSKLVRRSRTRVLAGFGLCWGEWLFVERRDVCAMLRVSRVSRVSRVGRVSRVSLQGLRSFCCRRRVASRL